MLFNNTSPLRYIFLRFAAFFLVLLLASAALAGGGPENFFLVVNQNSPASIAIANEYIHLRKFPAGNVFYLSWEPTAYSARIDDFREKILKPTLEAIESRGLRSQIDGILYSADLPYVVDLRTDIDSFKKDRRPPDAPQGVEANVTIPEAYWKPFTESGSITGMTFLYEPVLTKDSSYLSLQANGYCRFPNEKQAAFPTLGFRNAWQFNADGELLKSEGRSYFLSAMLGVTYGRGNTVEEILDYLKRSAAADGTYPRGTIYFMKNNDTARSGVRDKLFPEAVAELKKLGVAAQIDQGIEPRNRADVQGVVMGTADFDWEKSGSTILPGAICDNFTSYGGVFIKDRPQTPLSVFLRHGAAGASGTITEPFSLLQKFPLPMLQVHYARGCNLVESYYQAVYSPYQLLIVGDPLCQPWALIPKIDVDNLEPGQTVRGELKITPHATTAPGRGVDRFELFVNGARAARCKPGETLTIDTTQLPDGWQELRVVSISNDLVQTQGRLVLPIITDNQDRKITVNLLSEKTIRPGKPLRLEIDSPDSSGILVLQNSRLVGHRTGSKATISIDASTLGAGPVSLQVIGLGTEGPSSYVLAEPIDLNVDLPLPQNK